MDNVPSTCPYHLAMFNTFSLWTSRLIRIETLHKTIRQRQRENRQTKGLMSTTVVLHVRFESWYISYPSSATQGREMTSHFSQGGVFGVAVVIAKTP